MASIGTFLFLCTAIDFVARSSGQSFVTADCDKKRVGVFGQQSMLNCSLKLSTEVSEVNIRVIDWKRKGERLPVLLYNRGEKKVNPGYNFADPSWNKTLNISLLITNTTTKDDGEFTLFVSTNSGQSKFTTSLKVRAQYSPPKVHSIPEKILDDKDSMLICESGGGYPKGQLRWFDADGHDWTSSSKMMTKQMENGLFQLSSELPLLRGSTFSTYTCAVFSDSGSKEAEVAFQSSSERQEGEKKGNSATNIVAPVVVIGSLIVGLLLTLLLLYKRRTRYHHRELPSEEINVEEGGNQKMDK